MALILCCFSHGFLPIKNPPERVQSFLAVGLSHLLVSRVVWPWEFVALATVMLQALAESTRSRLSAFHPGKWLATVALKDPITGKRPGLQYRLNGQKPEAIRETRELPKATGQQILKFISDSNRRHNR
ncbi:hypothetical protein L7Q46_002616 [Serratia marcescens]|nr:hypothetical protein [Serratia marcescens]